MIKKLIRKMLTASGGPIKYISDIYLKLSDSPLASTIYDGTNLVLYAAAPFTGGATLIPAMAMTGLQATGASANIYDKGLNFLNGTDIASVIPGFGLLNKGVKLAMKPTMKMVGKTTKRVKNATKYLPKKESHPYTYRRMERVGNSGSRRVIRPVEHTIELGKYHPTFWLLAKEDKKYWPAAALVYGEDIINHGLNTYLVVKDIDLKKQGGKMNIIEFLKNGNKIKKALWGTNLDIDYRSDTTRQGSGIMPDSAYGAADASNTGGLLSLLDIFNTVKDVGPRNATLSNGKQITIPGVLTGTPTFLPTFGPGLLLQGRLVNYVMNPAEKAARADFLKSADEIKTLAGSGHIPKGIQGDWMYPTEILKKYKLKQFSTPVKQEASNLLKITKLSETSSAKKTSSLRSKEYYSKKKEDRNNGVSKVRSRLVLNNKAQTTGDMRAANTGRPRRAARYTDLKTELEKDKGFWGKQYNIIRRKIALGKQGAESKEKEFLESYWNYKQKGILNKEKFGGILFKKGGGIHIKEKNKGSFTRWCGGNVTEECIRKGKANSNPKIRRKATFADNARKWKHEKGGCFKGYPSKAAYDVRLEEVAGFKKGGKAFVEGVNVLDSNPDAYKHVKKKVKMRLYGGPLEYLFKEAQYLKWVNDYLNPTVINHNPDIDANRNFKFNNSILQLTDEYNNLKLLEVERINNEAQRYGSFLSKGLELLFGYLNKPKANNSTYSNPTYYNTTLEPKLVYSNGNQFKGGMLNTDPKTFFNL